MPLIAVIDTETTGDTDTDQVIELAAVYLDSDLSVHLMCRPTVPVHVEARATHHITDEELAAWPLAEQTYIDLRADIVAAHNDEFDRRMLSQTPFGALLISPARICTYRCARHIWPDAPRHTLQVLRYWLDIDFPVRAAHRAPADALLTATLLRRMLETHTVDDLLALSSSPVMLLTCPMGDHRGKTWAEVPMGMVDWLLKRPDLDADTRHTAQWWKDNPDRKPLLLPTIDFSKHSGTPWGEVDSGFLRWVLRNDFDVDKHFTARYWLDQRTDPGRLPPGYNEGLR